MSKPSLMPSALSASIFTTTIKVSCFVDMAFHDLSIHTDAHLHGKHVHVAVHSRHQCDRTPVMTCREICDVRKGFLFLFPDCVHFSLSLFACSPKNWITNCYTDKTLHVPNFAFGTPSTIVIRYSYPRLSPNTMPLFLSMMFISTGLFHCWHLATAPCRLLKWHRCEVIRILTVMKSHILPCRHCI